MCVALPAASIAAVLIIVFPLLLMSSRPPWYNEAWGLMFNVVLTVATASLSWFLARRQSYEKAAEKWLPAAEAAYRRLLTVFSNLESMRRGMSEVCTSLEQLMPPQDKALLPVRLLAGINCDESKAKLLMIRAEVSGALDDWRMFIRENCARGQCAGMFGRLRGTESLLEHTPDSIRMEKFLHASCELTQDEESNMCPLPQPPLVDADDREEPESGSPRQSE